MNNYIVIFPLNCENTPDDFSVIKAPFTLIHLTMIRFYSFERVVEEAYNDGELYFNVIRILIDPSRVSESKETLSLVY